MVQVCVYVCTDVAVYVDKMWWLLNCRVTDFLNLSGWDRIIQITQLHHYCIMFDVLMPITFNDPMTQHCNSGQSPPPPRKFSRNPGESHPRQTSVNPAKDI